MMSYLFVPACLCTTPTMMTICTFLDLQIRELLCSAMDAYYIPTTTNKRNITIHHGCPSINNYHRPNSHIYYHSCSLYLASITHAISALPPSRWH